MSASISKYSEYKVCFGYALFLQRTHTHSINWHLNLFNYSVITSLIANTKWIHVMHSTLDCTKNRFVLAAQFDSGSLCPITLSGFDFVLGRLCFDFFTRRVMSSNCFQFIKCLRSILCVISGVDSVFNARDPLNVYIYIWMNVVCLLSLSCLPALFTVFPSSKCVCVCVSLWALRIAFPKCQVVAEFFSHIDSGYLDQAANKVISVLELYVFGELPLISLILILA